VTPARLITGIITELGICQASEEALWAMMPHSQEAALSPGTDRDALRGPS
jgi:methylthioribose-1-phosphate isomerase